MNAVGNEAIQNKDFHSGGNRFSGGGQRAAGGRTGRVPKMPSSFFHDLTTHKQRAKADLNYTPDGKTCSETKQTSGV
jgi:hypothetical protein